MLSFDCSFCLIAWYLYIFLLFKTLLVSEWLINRVERPLVWKATVTQTLKNTSCRSWNEYTTFVADALSNKLVAMTCYLLFDLLLERQGERVLLC